MQSLQEAGYYLFLAMDNKSHAIRRQVAKAPWNNPLCNSRNESLHCELPQVRKRRTVFYFSQFAGVNHVFLQRFCLAFGVQFICTKIFIDMSSNFGWQTTQGNNSKETYFLAVTTAIASYEIRYRNTF